MHIAIPHAIRNNTKQNCNLLISINNMKRYKDKTFTIRNIVGLLFSSHMSFIITTNGDETRKDCGKNQHTNKGTELSAAEDMTPTALTTTTECTHIYYNNI
jgi:hypothetical protein